MTKFNPLARHQARYLAVQALYQWHITADSELTLEQQFLTASTAKKKVIDEDYFREIIHGVLHSCSVFDDLIVGHLSRPLADVNPVELAILRLSVFELKECADIPYRVILNEAVELAKVFGAQEAHKFVNGVLDKVAHDLRPLEMAVMPAKK